MKLYLRVVLYPLLVVVLAASGIAWGSARVQDDIGACLARPDGSRVTLPGEQVLWRGRSGKSFAIKEWNERQAAVPRLMVVSGHALPVKEFWSVDVTGVLATHNTSAGRTQRVLVVRPADVLVYCSPNGKPIPFIPVKMSGVAWEDKRSLPDLTASVQSLGSVSALDDEGLPPLPDSPESEPLPPAEGSRDSLKWLPDGAEVALNGVIVSAGFPDDGFYYVERPDRSFGIGIDDGSYVTDGTLMDITGTMATGQGERYVIASSADILDFDAYPRPREFLMRNEMLGGSQIGLFTPGMGGAVGPNNTGLLVRIYGRVTATDGSWYCVDDGAGLLAGWDPQGSEYRGVWVANHYAFYMGWPSWDPGHSPPQVGDLVAVSGVCAVGLLYDPITWDPLWPMAYLHAAWPVGREVAATRGTVSGTITAQVADGKTVRVYGESSSVTATFSNGQATFTGWSLPTGDNAVSATLPGYKTVTKLATVSEGENTALEEFALASLPKYIDVVADPARIEPGSNDTITVTAIVRDQEGRRLAGETVSWDTDVGSSRIVSADTTTDVIGEARMVIQPSASASTATVVASITAGATSRCFPEFAVEDAPSIRVLQPYRGDTATGEVEITVQSWDNGGTLPGVSTVSIFVDGVCVGSGPETVEGAAWASFRMANGSHEITATVTDFDGNAIPSNNVPVTSENAISQFSVSPSEIVANQPVHISATLTAVNDWQVAIEDVNGNSVFSTTGHGSAVSVDWPGTTQGGLYQALVTVGSSLCLSPAGLSLPIAFNATEYPDVLIVAGIPGYQQREIVSYIARTSADDGMTYAILMDDTATWDRIKHILSSPAVQYLYINYHGLAESWWGPVTQVYIAPKGSPLQPYILYARQLSGMPDAGEPDPSRWGWKVAYATELNRAQNRLTFAWIHACYSGRIGAFRPMRPDPGWDNFYYGQFGVYSCYEKESWNDMADALGITVEAAQETACGYVGWYGMGNLLWPTNGGPGPNGINYPGLLRAAWGTLALGYEFEFTRQWVHDTQEYTWKPIEDFGSRQGDGIGIRPYYNWRFWGNAAVSLFPWSP